MSTAQGILLTGATGLLGRYLLLDLLAHGHRVGVLLRDDGERTAAARLEELLAFGSESIGRKLPRPMLLQGELRTAGLGLGAAERHWLARQVDTVIHSAAYVAYQPTPDGEPWETNVNGTWRLLDLCRTLGVVEVHHVSTAFVCGDRRGRVREDELEFGGGSNNAYEQSKFAAEEMVRDFPGIRATIYRPAVIVGDSQTGYTSTYHHFYRFLELAVRLSARKTNEGEGRQSLPLRLPLTGEETQNLVPVDWVARALVELVQRPQWHGRTYHLVGRRPVRLGEITDIIQELLHLEGIRWIGPEGVTDPTAVERLVLEQFQEYWSYLHNDLRFDCRNTRAALPDLPPPTFDRDLVARLLRFAERDGWGRRRTQRMEKHACDLAHYLEHILPREMQRSPLADALPDGLVFALDIRGPGGGRWVCRGGTGTLAIQRGNLDGAAFTYRMESAILTSLIVGRQSAQQAFLDGLIEIDGDMEKALKLALLIEQFLAERASPAQRAMEAVHAVGF